MIPLDPWQIVSMYLSILFILRVARAYFILRS